MVQADLLVGEVSRAVMDWMLVMPPPSLEARSWENSTISLPNGTGSAGLMPPSSGVSAAQPLNPLRDGKNKRKNRKKRILCRAGLAF
ncbi:hypothetical protein DV515_00015982 [Chloebia gouldiae]|uniref:Uncharacterized protein n=1 Tax=Chloebia gouldiae TaxID=44316 RepID=A0A3L8RTQ7_CHLGU|nr:hypothetical protein DV515_00015982 [Chloebia gouldiae]